MFFEIYAIHRSGLMVFTHARTTGQRANIKTIETLGCFKQLATPVVSIIKMKKTAGFHFARLGASHSPRLSLNNCRAFAYVYIVDARVICVNHNRALLALLFKRCSLHVENVFTYCMTENKMHQTNGIK